MVLKTGTRERWQVVPSENTTQNWDYEMFHQSSGSGTQGSVDLLIIGLERLRHIPEVEDDEAVVAAAESLAEEGADVPLEELLNKIGR